MLAEHRQIVDAPRGAARRRACGRASRARALAEALVLHAQTEELVLYPAAILIGEHVERSLSEAAAAL